MRKKSVAIVVAVVVVLYACVPLLNGCKNETPKMREVELELINPNTGEVLHWDEHVKVPETKTKVEVRIKDKETGQYLTDDDLPETTIEDSCSVGFRPINRDGKYGAFIQSYSYWPQSEQLLSVYNRYFSNYYVVDVSFDCYPKYMSGAFPRKYMWTSRSWNLYLE